MPKHEPWFKPRKDEDADDELLDWLGGGGNGNKPKQPEKSGWGCFRIALPVAVGIVTAILLAVFCA